MVYDQEISEKKKKILRAIPKFPIISYQEFLLYLIFILELPAVSDERFSRRNNFRIFLNLSAEVSVPFCPLFKSSGMFWVNEKRLESPF